MKKYFIVSSVLIFLVFFLPWVTAAPSGANIQLPSTDTQSPCDPPTSPEAPSPAAEVIPTGEIDSSISITVLMDGSIVEMDLGSYLVGVVRAEMPASFALDALKAQAVAARTYTLYKIANGGSNNHPDADTCTDITCCKAYMDGATAAALWGEQAPDYEAKLRAAVTETDGECVLYDGEPVLAVFHSSSAGMTLDAQDVWSSSLPYLVSVSSPETADTVPNFVSEVSFFTSELRTILLNALPQAALSGVPSNWFSNIRQLPNGTVTSLQVGGIEISGSAFRSLLGLRSACFTISFDDSSVIFSVTGYGHGVGMSQYGADLLADSGLSYREILTWYYTDTTVGIYTSSLINTPT